MGEKEKKRHHGGIVYPDAHQIFSVRAAPLPTKAGGCKVVLDASALLAPFGAGSEALEAIGKILNTLIRENRLFVPAQAAREFASNRPTKIVALHQHLKSQQSKPTSVGQQRYPMLDPLPEYQELLRLEQVANEAIAAYRKGLSAVIERVQAWGWDDPLSKLYGEAFTPAVVIEPKVEFDQVSERLSLNTTHKLPPGFKDSDKSDGGAGDIWIWETILHVADLHKCDVVFATGEEKNDWWHKSADKDTLYPRFELQYEFNRRSGGRTLHMMKLSALLEALGAPETTVAEVRQSEVATPEETPVFANAALSAELERWVRPRLGPSARDAYNDTGFDFTFQRGERQLFVMTSAATANRHILGLIRDMAIRVSSVNEGGRVGYGLFILAARTRSRAARIQAELERLDIPRGCIFVFVVPNEHGGFELTSMTHREVDSDTTNWVLGTFAV